MSYVWKTIPHITDLPKSLEIDAIFAVPYSAYWYGQNLTALTLYIL